MIYGDMPVSYWRDYAKAEDERSTQDFWKYIDECEEQKSELSEEEWLKKISTDYHGMQHNVPMMNSLHLAVKNDVIDKTLLKRVTNAKKLKEAK